MSGKTNMSGSGTYIHRRNPTYPRIKIQTSPLSLPVPKPISRPYNLFLLFLIIISPDPHGEVLWTPLSAVQNCSEWITVSSGELASNRETGLCRFTP